MTYYRSWDDCSCFTSMGKEFLNEYNKSDLFIAKGQGNYEALSDKKKYIFSAKNKVSSSSWEF